MALALTICVRASLAAPAPQASCAPPSATILRTVGQVIVYRTVPLGRAHVRSVRSCRAGVGDMLLARNGYYEGFGGRRAVAARGNEVAWVKVSRDDGADGDVAVLDVIARDLGTRVPRLSARSNGSRYVVNDAGISISADGVPSIVIAADRSVAWIACDNGSSRDKNEHYDRCGVGPRSVWLATDGTSTTRPNNSPPKELARGHTIEARSLRVDASGSVLTWRQNGRLHRVQL